MCRDRNDEAYTHLFHALHNRRRYKLVRTPTPGDLVADFYSYAGVRRRLSFLLDALRRNDEPTISYFAALREIPALQVRGCRDRATGRTPLHFVALQPDGRCVW